jgi:hypothetical protein
MIGKRLINFNVTTAGDALLTAFAQQTGRTKTDVLREAVRALETRLARAPKAARPPKAQKP